MCVSRFHIYIYTYPCKYTWIFIFIMLLQPLYNRSFHQMEKNLENDLDTLGPSRGACKVLQGCYTTHPIVENQMEHQTDNAMEAGS